MSPICGLLSEIGCDFWYGVAEAPSEQIELAPATAYGVGEAFGSVRGMAGRAMHVRHLHHVHCALARAESRSRVADDWLSF